MGKDQTTTPESSCPSLYDEYVGSLTSPADHSSEDAGDGTYGLSSLSKKTRTTPFADVVTKVAGSPQFF